MAQKLLVCSLFLIKHSRNLDRILFPSILSLIAGSQASTGGRRISVRFASGLGIPSILLKQIRTYKINIEDYKS